MWWGVQFSFWGGPKALWGWRRRRGGITKMLKSFMAAVLLSALVERFSVSHMRVFFVAFLIKINLAERKKE